MLECCQGHQLWIQCAPRPRFTPTLSASHSTCAFTSALQTAPVDNLEVSVSSRDKYSNPIVGQTPTLTSTNADLTVSQQLTSSGADGLSISKVGTTAPGDFPLSVAWTGVALNCSRVLEVAAGEPSASESVVHFSNSKTGGAGTILPIEVAPKDASRYPGNSELCNGIDDDCDGLIDNGVICDEVDGGTQAIGEEWIAAVEDEDTSGAESEPAPPVAATDDGGCQTSGSQPLIPLIGMLLLLLNIGWRRKEKRFLR